VYLLDTNVLSDATKRRPSPRLLERLSAVPVELQMTASVVVGELIYGAERDRPNRTERLRHIEEAIAGSLTVLPFDTDAARRYGWLRAELERRGERLDDPDLQIAAIALTHDLTVVTANTRHFERIPGLRVENWL